MTLMLLLFVTTCLMFGNAPSTASPLDKRFLLLFGHQYNNPADMSNEFAGSTGGGAASQSTSQTGSSSSAGSGIPGDATVYLDQTHHQYHVASGGNAGYVQHAGNSGPGFASQSVSTGHGTDHLPGKCPWISCSPDCQDVDGVTGCVICKSTCATSSGSGGSSSGSASLVGAGNGGGASVSGSGTGNGINVGSGGTGVSQTGSASANGNSPFNLGGGSQNPGAGVMGGTGTQGSGTGAQATGIGGLGLGTGSQVTGSGLQGTGTGVHATGIGGLGLGTGPQAAGSGSHGTGTGVHAAGTGGLGPGTGTQTTGSGSHGTGTGTQGTGTSGATCAPFPANCPRGSFAIVNGCPECTAVKTTSIPTTHAPRVTCKPIQCLAPCNKGVRIDPATHCPVCIC